MYNFKLFTTSLLLCLSTVMFAQEICDNGIDDDNDGLIDLNDDECICDNTIELTNITGTICNNNLILTMDDPDAVSHQWYQNGIAIAGETNADLVLMESADVDGNYQVLVTKPDGCYLTENHEVTVELYEVYLGEEYICEGDTVFFGGFALTFSGFFQHDAIAVDGCDSITTLTVVVQTPTFGHINADVCDGQPFVYHDLNTDVPGEYEVELQSLGGCDSLVTVILTEGTPTDKFVDATICPGETYEDYGISTDTPGMYEAIVDNPLGCDTLVTINLTLIDPPTISVVDEFCPGDTYNDHGVITDVPGIYESILENTNGCDTILTLELFQTTPPNKSINASICDGEIYEEYGLQETTTGSYESIIPASQGCDTLLTIELTVETEPIGFITEYICLGDTYIFQDIEETESGTYSTTYNYGGVCDSTVNVELIVTETIELDLVRTLCDGEVFDQFGIFADTEGEYNNTITSPTGCDSIITLSLSYAGPTESFITEAICPGTSFELYDINENTPGDYSTIIQNIHGCDSTINVALSILPEATEELFFTICKGDEFEYEGTSYTDEDIYYNNYISENGCDSTLAINLTVIEQPTAFREVFICEGEIFEYGPMSEDREGLYEFIIENPGECDSIITVQLFVVEPGEGVELAYYHTVNYGNPIDISPEFMGEGVTDIIWMNEEGIEIGTGPVLEDFMTLNDTSIFLNGTDANGCPVEARAIIDVTLEIDIFIPNIFTPDGDGDNDTFQVYGGPTVSQLKEIYIYDKWGELMHSAKDVPATDEYIGWDGMFQGRRATQGAYAYIAIFDIVTGAEKTVTGMVTLVY